VENGRSTLSLNRLILDQPSLEAAGELRLGHEPALVQLDLQGKNIDLSSAKEAVLAFAGDVPHIKEICDALKGGEVVTASFEAQVRAFSDLWDIEHMRVAAVFEKGRASLPESDLEVAQVGAKVGISGGVFIAEELKASLGNSRITGGQLEVNLLGSELPYSVDISFDADVGELRPELTRYVNDEGLKKELSRITRLEGRVKGKIGIRKAAGPVQLNLEASYFKLVGNHDEVPYPIEIDGGHLRYDGTRAEAGNVNVKVGGSSVSGLSARLDMKAEPVVKLATGMRISLDEIFPWLSGYEELKEALQQIVSLKGNMNLSAFQLQGPLNDPGKWSIAASGSLEKAEVGLKEAKHRIRVSRADFDVTRKGGKGRISFKGIKAGFLDAAVEASGHMDYGAGGVEQLRLKFDGRGGDVSLSRAFDFVDLPPAMAIRPPISVSDGRLQWGKGKQTSVAGNFTIADGPVIAVDVTHSPERLNIRRLHIKDEASDAVITLDLKEREALFEFKGRFAESTAGRILADNRIPPGSIRGDFSARVLLDRPLESRVTGVLEGKDLLVPWNIRVPILIDRLALEADGGSVKVTTARVTWENMKLEIEADLNFSEVGLVLKADVATDELDLTRIEQMLGEEPSEPGDAEEARNGGWDLPFLGMIRLKTGVLKHELMTLEPFHADISFAEEGLHVAVKEARLCGISFPGVLGLNSEGISVDFSPKAEDQDFAPTVTCLSKNNSKITGRFDFNGRFKGKGKASELLENLQGGAKINARNGRYEKDIIMSRLFAYLNVTDLFKGNVPSLEEEGFVYHTIDSDMEMVKGGLLRFTAVIDGVSMDIGAEGEIDLVNEALDIRVLVAPLKTVDWFVKRLPLIRHIFGGNLVTIPVRVSGSFQDPKVTAMSPSAVGAELTGILRRTFELPVKIIEPVIPKKKNGATEN